MSSNSPLKPICRISSSISSILISSSPTGGGGALVWGIWNSSMIRSVLLSAPSGIPICIHYMEKDQKNIWPLHTCTCTHQVFHWFFAIYIHTHVYPCTAIQSKNRYPDFSDYKGKATGVRLCVVQNSEKRKETHKASKLTTHTTQVHRSRALDAYPSTPSVKESTFEGVQCIQWNLSNKDTLGTEGSVLISEVSWSTYL